MSRTAWKTREREIAMHTGTTRYWANAGERVDCESKDFVIQVKERKALSLAQLEALAQEMDREADQRSVSRKRKKLGLVATKRSARKPTPWLITMTLETFKLFAARKITLPEVL